MPTTSPAIVPTRRAAAVACSHAGEILQGAIRKGERVCRLLWSLPAPALWTRAELIPTPGHRLTLDPPWAHKAFSAAGQLLAHFGLPEPEAVIR